MNIILQIYWLTVLAGVMSALIEMMASKGANPFKAMGELQKSLEDLPPKWATILEDLINWMFDNAPLGTYIVIASISIIPVINLIYTWINIKNSISED